MSQGLNIHSDKKMITQIIIAWIWGHILEYLAHKYLLHDRRRFPFAFKNHFQKHHRAARKNQMYDPGYESVVSSWFEIEALTIAAFIHFPIIFFFPAAYLTLVMSLVSYYLLHRKSHLNVEWGKKWMPWHYAHHMGPDQNKNWGVRLPIIDLLMRTSDFKR